MLKLTVAVLVLCFSFPALLSAGELNNPGGSAYQDLLSAQQQMLQSELNQHRTRLSSFEELLAGGHASWLEVQRQRLKTQTMEAQVDLLNQLAASVEQARQSRPGESIFDGMLDSRGKLLFTDLQLKTGSSDLAAESALFQQFMAQSQQNVVEAYKKPVANQMQFAAAHQALAAEFQNWMQDHGEADNGDAAQGTSQISEELLAASRKQCEVHDQMLELTLVRERDRLQKVNELFAENMTSSRDIDILKSRINELLVMQQYQQRVMDYLMQQQPSPAIELESGVERSLTQEIQFQFELHEARFQQTSSNLEAGLLREILSRLEVAAAKTANQQGSRLSNTLAIGQQNEINGYRHKIRMMELKSEFAQCRIDVLKAQGDSGKFFEVVIADEPAQSSGFAVGLSAATSPASLINVLTVAGHKSAPLPSALLDRTFDPFPFAFQSHRNQFQSASLTRRSSVSYSSSLPKISGSSSILSSRYQSILSSRRSGSSISNSSLYSNRTSSHYRPRTLGRAYQFGVIRSDLRPFLNVGQPPWYFPGSATNLRTQQLRTNNRFSTFGVSGNQLLRSTQFTDLYGR